MILNIATICDNAFTDQSGRLSIIQTFDKIYINKLGSTHPRITVVATYQVEAELPSSEFNGRFTVNILDNKQAPIATLSIDKPDLKIDEKKLNFICSFVNLPLGSDGEYTIKLSFPDKAPDMTLPLTVVLLPPESKDGNN